MPHTWLFVSTKDLAIEHRQLTEEGRDLSTVEREFEALGKLDLDNDLSLQPAAEALLKKCQSLPQRKDYPLREPSDLEGIRAERPAQRASFRSTLSDAALRDKLHGAWLGRIAGCLLGKPVEGWKSEVMWGFLKETGNYPLAGYFRSDVAPAIVDKYKINTAAPFINNVTCMVQDDDTNYTVAGLAILKQYGRDFTPRNVADFWMGNIPLLSTCTAERIAYRNFARLIDPPASAVVSNPYREWIGAQIRADFFGYAAPGRPELAAEFAFRDASISHVKNGIYGELWVAAMLAAAACESDMIKVIRAGLDQIPRASRLTKAIEETLGWHRDGVSYDEAVKRIHTTWNEHDMHDWCHTISNAVIVAVALLWGEADFEKTICRAVQPCFDTDCNGATAGSVLGMILGAKALPRRMLDPFNETLETGVASYMKVKVSDLVQESLAVVSKIGM